MDCNARALIDECGVLKNMKRQNRAQVLDQKRSIKSTDLIDQKDQMVDQLIANRQTDADANFSFVELSFSQNPVITKERVINAAMNAYQVPFWRSMYNSFFNGWQYFLNLIIIIINLWMFIIAGIVVTYGLKYYYKTKKIAIVR